MTDERPARDVPRFTLTPETGGTHHEPEPAPASKPAATRKARNVGDEETTANVTA